MSASNQKKLRREQAEARMTERQLAEAKEKKKLKIYTTTFWVVMALCVCIVLGSVASNPIKNVIYRNTKAVTIGNHTLDAVTVNYFFVDAVQSTVSQYGNYISYFMDTTKPLDEQLYNETEGVTWAAQILGYAMDNIKSTYALYDLAIEKGHEMTEDEKKSVETMFSQLDLYAQLYGYKSANAYLTSLYGNGADVKSYRAYYEVSAMADSYYTAYSDSLEFEDADLRAYEKGKFQQYSSYTYTTYYLSAAKFYEGGTKGEDGKYTYTDEEKAAAAERAQAIANQLAAGTYETREDFDKAIAELECNKDLKDQKSTVYENTLFNKISTLYRDWVVGKVVEENKDEKTSESDDEKDEEEEDVYVDRKPGEMTVQVSESTSGETKVINGYYVVRFEAVEDNTTYMLKNVRHILVKFTGGSYNSSTGTTTYTDAEKNKAKLAAEAILKQFEDGNKTEDAFAALAKEKSEDTGSKENGGLYEDIYPGQMVEDFEKWCFDAERKTGDTGLVESTYGYHVMFFVGNSEISYRDYMVEKDLKNQTLTDWHQSLIDNAILKELNLKYVNTDMTVG